MKLSIIIVSWNTRDLIVKCVNSILQNAPGFDCEIIVLDNNSRDGSAGVLTDWFGHNKRVRIIRSLKNLGFAKGNNLAYENSSGEYVLFLNPDTEVKPGALEKLANYLEQHPETGIAGPKLLNPDGSLQPSVRRFPDIWSSLLVFSGLHRIIRPRRYLMDDFSYEREAEVDQVMGAALMTRRKIIEQLGLFDENFWLWYEEVDFCRRVKKAGWKIIFYPEAVVCHHTAQSFQKLTVYRRKKTVAKSLIYYFRKHGSFFDHLLIRLTLPVVLLAAKVLDFLQRIFNFRIKPR